MARKNTRTKERRKEKDTSPLPNGKVVEADWSYPFTMYCNSLVHTVRFSGSLVFLLLPSTSPPTSPLPLSYLVSCRGEHSAYLMVAALKQRDLRCFILSIQYLNHVNCYLEPFLIPHLPSSPFPPLPCHSIPLPFSLLLIPYLEPCRKTWFFLTLEHQLTGGKYLSLFSWIRVHRCHYIYKLTKDTIYIKNKRNQKRKEEKEEEEEGEEKKRSKVEV